MHLVWYHNMQAASCSKYQCDPSVALTQEQHILSLNCETLLTVQVGINHSFQCDGCRLLVQISQDFIISLINAT